MPPLFKETLPVHLGIIMDGNRRWAKAKNFPSSSGHSRGAETFKSMALYCNKIGIKYLTVYAFSTENWKRPKPEVSSLMFLFKKNLKNAIEEFDLENIKTNFLGDISKFSPDIQELMSKLQTKSQNNTGMVLNIAINYGGREEILNAVKKTAADILKNKINTEDICEEYFSKKMYTSNQPDVDFVVRTAGEKRLSNFMLWQCAYSEFYSTKTLWPDFTENDLNTALEEYSRRIRKFGGV